MKPREFYLWMSQQITHEHCKAVMDVLIDHIGATQTIAIGEIAALALKDNTNTGERVARGCIQILRRDYHVPVMSNSKTEGRWLPGSKQEIESAIVELERRERSLHQTIEGMKAAREMLADGDDIKANLKQAMLI